jgi:hypothetical protein
MDRLKEYLLCHKADLEVDSPASDAWEQIMWKIRNESHPTGFAMGSEIPAGSGFSKRMARYAAAACLIALAGVGIWLVIKSNTATPDTAKHDSGTIKKEPAPRNATIENALRKEEEVPGKNVAGNNSKPKQARQKARAQKPAELPDEIAVIDKSYSNLIDYQLKKLRGTPLYAENGSYFSFYVEQFKQMDQDERQVKNDINTYGLTNEYLEQLINVYQQKLNVLKNLQTEINKMNNKVRQKEAPSEKGEVYYLNI